MLEQLTKHEQTTIFHFIHDQIDNFTPKEWELLENLDDEGVAYVIELKEEPEEKVKEGVNYDNTIRYDEDGYPCL